MNSWLILQMCIWLVLSWHSFILLAVTRWICRVNDVCTFGQDYVSVIQLSVWVSIKSTLQGDGLRGWRLSASGHPWYPGDHRGPHHCRGAGFRWWSDWLLHVCLDWLLMRQGRDNQLTTGSMAGSNSKISETDWMWRCISHMEIQPSINYLKANTLRLERIIVIGGLALECRCFTPVCVLYITPL